MGSGIRKRKKKTKDNVRVPQELQLKPTFHRMAHPQKWKLSLSKGAVVGGQETKKGLAGRSSFSWLSDILGKILFSNY